MLACVCITKNHTRKLFIRMWKSRFVIWDDSKYPLREKVSIMMGFICIGGGGRNDSMMKLEGWWMDGLMGWLMCWFLVLIVSRRQLVLGY